MPKFTVKTEINCGKVYCNKCCFKIRMMWTQFCARHLLPNGLLPELVDYKKTAYRLDACKQEEKNIKGDG